MEHAARKRIAWPRHDGRLHVLAQHAPHGRRRLLQLQLLPFRLRPQPRLQWLAEHPAAEGRRVYAGLRLRLLHDGRDVGVTAAVAEAAVALREEAAGLRLLLAAGGRRCRDGGGAREARVHVAVRAAEENAVRRGGAGRRGGPLV